ncbi:hypothetical protein Cgig2_017375 [Carnegiea gigantea]|uniref:TMEM205-like domain-containing protein n=1 Tax=Carnegiea gigantea TaxID=171969 RepID=A0A9Q1QDQ5_9CARY|nr:hypothetical protein Cgig2_017375 [Carnegiea gigantea]
MMNLIAITLVATSLVVAGLFSPTPHINTNNGGPQVIVKEGHRAVVVEYADTTGDGNTKVSISPSETTKGGGASAGEEAKGKAEEALSTHVGGGARELICDAFGKCKEKIGGAWSKTKEKAAETEEEVKEAVDKAKDLAAKATHKAEESTQGVRENVKEKVREAGEAAERVKEKARETGDKARETAESVKGKTGEVVRETAEKVKSKTGEVVEETTEKIKETGRKGKKELSDISKRGKEVMVDAFGYVFGSGSTSSLMGVLQMLGFAMAYGISVWVTFIMSHVLAGVLPRQQFGMVQSKIYPVYFKAMVGSIGLALIGHLMAHKGKLFKSKADMLQAYNLLGSLLLVLANLQILEPRASKVMFERMKLEKEEGRGAHGSTPAPTRVIDTVLTDSAGRVQTASTTTSPTPPRPEQDEAKSKLAKLDDRLKKLNSYSSLLNIGTLMGLTWHLVYLSQRLAAGRSS